MWGPFPDIWCSFGRGMKWLWRSRRNDRQTLFCAYFLQRSAIVSLTHSLTYCTRSHTHSRDCGCCSAGAAVLVLVLMLAGWWPIRLPPIHPLDHALRNHFLFSCNVLGVPDGQLVNRLHGYTTVITVYCTAYL